MGLIAKLFMSGRSQAVRLPKALRFDGKEVVAKRFGNGVLLLPTDAPFALMREALDVTLVTNNTREFERVAGLRLDNWVA